MASQRRVVFRLALVWLLWAWAGCAVALDPALDIGQYAHTAWKIRDGFSKGRVITAFAQGSDGYLWLGTGLGLLRFDGVQAVPWQPPPGVSLSNDGVRTLRAARDGTLWIGTGDGLASWNGARLVSYPQLEGHYINAIVEDHEGTVWVGGMSRSGPGGLFCAIRGATTQCDSDAKEGVLSLYENASAALWVATPHALWRWKPGPPISYPLDDNVLTLQALSETATGTTVILTAGGLQQVGAGKVEAFPFRPTPQRTRAAVVLRDRDGGLWIGTRGEGLLHLHDGRIDAFAHLDGLSGDTVVRLFEDREGSVWVTTTEGIDRFHALAAATYSSGQGVPPSAVAVMADKDGSLWLSTARGLRRWFGGRMTEVIAEGLPDRDSASSLFQDRQGRVWLGALSGLGYLANGRFTPVAGVSAGYIDAITQDREGNLWIAHRDEGLLRLSADFKLQRIPWARFAQLPGARVAVDPGHGGLWIGFFSGGLVHFVDGQVRESYSVRDGWGKGSINDVRVEADGTVWAASDGGLSRLKAGRIATLDTRSGLPCDHVHSMVFDVDTSVWLYTVCGLVRIARSDLDGWAASVDRGMAPPRIRATVLDSSDGVPSIALLGTFTPHIAQSPDGKLWFMTYEGVTMVDSRHLPFNHLPPPVHIERIVADRKDYAPSTGLHLPPLLRDLRIDYTALSLVAPEKNRFRYKLEGHDDDWQDAGNRREAFYADLDPGNYRFRVIASNNSGVWSEQGATLDFSIAPAYWQTNWFRALCVAVLVALLWTLYRLRVHQLARQFNLTLEARVNERTRIARDLHDTLLQSFHGLLLRFQTAFDLLPARPADARQVLGSAIDQAAGAITEGRDAVQGLRASTEETNDLADAIRALGGALSAEERAAPGVALRIDLQGGPRELHPIVRDELVRIAGEAMRNAFRHAAAKHVEVEIHYDDRRLRVRVRDDGKGIAAETLQAGAREGHFGLPGMRERARIIGGKLTVWSAVDAGTEVEVSIPAAHAYAAVPSTPGWRARLRSILHRNAKATEP
jgi:signal transduction histidine kinase/ligand-binding sensor domain-containing protein